MSTMITREPTRKLMVQRRRARPRGLRGCAEPLRGLSRRLDAQRAFRSSNTKLSRVWLTLPPVAAALLALPGQKLNRSEQAICTVPVASESSCTRGGGPILGRSRRVLRPSPRPRDLRDRSSDVSLANLGQEPEPRKISEQRVRLQYAARPVQSDASPGGRGQGARTRLAILRQSSFILKRGAESRGRPAGARLNSAQFRTGPQRPAAAPTGESGKRRSPPQARRPCAL